MECGERCFQKVSPIEVRHTRPSFAPFRVSYVAASHAIRTILNLWAWESNAMIPGQLAFVDDIIARYMLSEKKAFVNNTE